MKTEDPWFSAITPVHPQGYSSDEPLGVLGCVTHQHYCNPDRPSKHNRMRRYISKDAEGALSKAWPDLQDQSAIRPLLSALSTTEAGFLDSFYALPGLPTLLSRNTLLANMQTAALAVNQWQIEREHIYKASMAAIQSMVVEYTRGLSLGSGSLCATDTPYRRICNSQVCHLHKTGELF
jgi:hypothetical protein